MDQPLAGGATPEPITIGVDIGTTSVKAVAVGADGRIVASARVPHPVLTPAPNVLEHDADLAWRIGVRYAAIEVAEAAAFQGHDVAAVNVAAMVPSLCPVDDRGVPIGPGLLYGDERAAGGARGLNPSEDGELVRMLAWLAEEYPGRGGFLAGAGRRQRGPLSGVGAIDTVIAMTTCRSSTTRDGTPGRGRDAGVTVGSAAGDRLGHRCRRSGRR